MPPLAFRLLALPLALVLASCVGPPSGGVRRVDLGEGEGRDGGDPLTDMRMADLSTAGDLGPGPLIDGGDVPPGDGGGGARDGATADDGGIGPAEDDGGVGGTADGGGPTGGDREGNIFCGPLLCSAPGEQCCVSGIGDTARASCTPRSSACPGASATCDGPEDCDESDLFEEACCARIGATATAVTRCTRYACGNGITEFELCHDRADCRQGNLCCPYAMFGISTGICADACP